MFKAQGDKRYGGGGRGRGGGVGRQTQGQYLSAGLWEPPRPILSFILCFAVLWTQTLVLDKTEEAGLKEILQEFRASP